LSGNYNVKIFDANKISKRLGEGLEFSTLGKISGTGINNINLDGTTDIFHGDGTYSIDLKKRKISKIVFALNNIQFEEVLTGIVKKGEGLVGKANVYGNLFVENLRPTIGSLNICSDTLMVNDSTKFSQLTSLSIPIGTKGVINTSTIFNGYEAVSNVDLKSNIAQLQMQDNHIDLKTKNIKSDYSIDISDLKDICISDSSNITFHNNQLPGLKRIKSVLDKRYLGNVLIGGHFHGKIEKLIIEGVIVDLSEISIKKENPRSKALPFELQDNILTIHEITKN